MGEIVLNGGLVTVATVILSFLFRQVLVWRGIELSELATKLIVFTVAVGVTVYSAHQGGLPVPPSGDPMELATFLLAMATAEFKVAQELYDRLLKDILSS